MGLKPDLLIDIGNSRVKWRWAGQGDVSSVAHQGDVADIVAGLPPGQPARIAVSQVLGVEAGASLAAALHARYGTVPVMATVRATYAGLQIAYADPARLGVDRWLAMLAARQQAPDAPVVVAMAGTALTLDVVDQHGRHLGGIIAPGLVTARNATLDATRFEHRSTASMSILGLGAHTEACVEAGARAACLGALDRSAAFAPTGAHRFISGGDADALFPDLPGWRLMPDAVLGGLMAMLSATD